MNERHGARRPAVRRVACVAACASAVAAGVAAQEAECDAEAWREVVVRHATRYPALGMQDLYKLLHQGVFGSGHAVDDVAGARAWLKEELRALRPEEPRRGGDGVGGGRLPDASPNGLASARVETPEPLVEPVSPGGRIVRVHLGPFLSRGGDPEVLLEAFVATANRPMGSRESFMCAASAAGAAGVGSWSRAEWERFVAERENVGLPAIGHSPAFEAAYRPSYRVIAADLLPGLLP